MPRSQIRRAEIRASRELLLELAERVDSRGPVGVEGLALTSLLIGDRASPLYDGDARRSLAATAFTALVALERGLPDGQDHRQLEREARVGGRSGPDGCPARCRGPCLDGMLDGR